MAAIGAALAFQVQLEWLLSNANSYYSALAPARLSPVSRPASRSALRTSSCCLPTRAVFPLSTCKHFVLRRSSETLHSKHAVHRLSDTSPVGRWVTDSAAGMTAIVTGQKTRNG